MYILIKCSFEGTEEGQARMKLRNLNTSPGTERPRNVTGEPMWEGRGFYRQRLGTLVIQDFPGVMMDHCPISYRISDRGRYRDSDRRHRRRDDDRHRQLNVLSET
ncbi:hypothetical protein EVAR_48206_1 [Eumeta japonica]|uniref:Uncharacterized protein n=1 Tax=Eumeta variegata TaxID=151549 RepID=A0A4C1XTH0_EUMVA|nr:hypothetical protein EVAR_48206_1 [Eumeta japonica]